MRRTQSHAHRHVGVLDHLCELLKADLAVVVEIRFHDSLVHNLVIPKSAVYSSPVSDPPIVNIPPLFQKLTCCNC